MADQKLTALTALAALSADDLFYVVDDPAGAATSHKLATSVLDARFASAAQGALAATALQPADIGVTVQGYDADLATIAGLAKTDGNFIVGDGAAWVVESGATARTSLGLAAGGAGDIWVEKAGDVMTGTLEIQDALAITRTTNAFGTTSIYTALVVGDLTGATADNGGLYAIARKNKANEPFTALSGWDDGSNRYLYFGGGGWNVPDATRMEFYIAPSYSETNDTGALLMALSPGLINTHGRITYNQPSATDAKFYSVNPNDANAKLFNWNLWTSDNAGSARDNVGINWGYNQAAGGGVEDNTDPSFYQQIETFYQPAGTSQFEYHWDFFKSGGADPGVRPMHLNMHHASGEVDLMGHLCAFA